MSFRRLGLGLVVLVLLAGIAACSRKAREVAQVRADLDQVCRAQKSYLETKKLMRTVAEADLSKERDARFTRDVKTAAVRAALSEAQRAPAGRRRKALDAAAVKAGMQGWDCPELDLL